jgi:hypothetical protein
MPPRLLTWEQFMPPHQEIPAVLFGGLIQERLSLKLKPFGEPTPLKDERYLLYNARYSTKEEKHTRFFHERGFALVVIFDDRIVASITSVDLWVDEDHRRSKVEIDLAAEMWLEHVLRRGDTGHLEQRYGRDGKPVPMIKPTIKAGMRAYKLGIERGCIALPEGYVIPEV